jgi:hypothetical protein
MVVIYLNNISSDVLIIGEAEKLLENFVVGAFAVLEY